MTIVWKSRRGSSRSILGPIEPEFGSALLLTRVSLSNLLSSRSGTGKELRKGPLFSRGGYPERSARDSEDFP